MLTHEQPAPSFHALDQDGRTQTLSDYRGRWVLLYFYPKDDTPGCTTEACAFRDASDQYADRLVVLGVSADSVESHRDFARTHRLPFPLLADPEKAIVRAYAAGNLIGVRRVSYLIDPQGTIARVYPLVRPATHVRDVLRDLDELTRSA